MVQLLPVKRGKAIVYHPGSMDTPPPAQAVVEAVEEAKDQVQEDGATLG